MRNPAGIRAYQKAGFKEIGRRRECRMMGGKLWDEVHMDCLSSEFESRVLRMCPVKCVNCLLHGPPLLARHQLRLLCHLLRSLQLR